METIRLNDGTVIQNVLTIEAIVGLWVHIQGGLSFSEAYELFSDPDATSVITSDKREPHRPEEDTVYEGYTDLYMLKREDDGMIVVGLHKGA